MLASSDASTMAPLLDVKLSGMILTGSSAYEALKPLQRQTQGLLVAIEPVSVTKYTATVEKPFQLATDGLFDQILAEFLDGQPSSGAAAGRSGVYRQAVCRRCTKLATRRARWQARIHA